MLFTLGQRTRLDLSVQHERSPLYVQLSDGAIRYNYTLKLRNMELRPRTVEGKLRGLPGPRPWSDDGSRGTASQRLRMALTHDREPPEKHLVVSSPPGRDSQQTTTTASV